MNNRKSFLIHIDSLDILDDLTNEQCGELFKAIKSHHTNQKQSLSQLVSIAFSPFKNQFKRDNEKYQKTCEARALAGSRGGKQKVANASKSKQKVAKLADSVNDSKSDSDSDNDSDSKVIKKTSRFKPPTVQEVSDYCIQRNNKVDPESFINHYETTGWMRGKNKIKNWKSCVITWESNANEKARSNNRNNETPTDRSRIAADKLRRQEATYSQDSTLIQINDRPIRQ